MNDPASTTSRAVGRRIAAARQSSRLTQAELARQLGWPRDTLAHYEYGRRSLSVDRLELIARALHIPPAALMTDEPQLAALITRLARDEALRQQVAFFVGTLDDAG